LRRRMACGGLLIPLFAPISVCPLPDRGNTLRVCRIANHPRHIDTAFPPRKHPHGSCVDCVCVCVILRHLPFLAATNSLVLDRPTNIFRAARPPLTIVKANIYPTRIVRRRDSEYSRVGDLCAQPLSGACTVRVRVPGNRLVSSWRLRFLLPILFICLACPLSLQGCAGLAVAESTAMVDWQPPANVPMTIRTLNADGRFSQISSVAVAERLRALHPREPLEILALSGGGAYGAFGAGAVAGLTRTGSRPDFTVVTGVSVGALIAPYAFLGPTWDADRLDVFTGAPGEEHLLQSRGLAAIFSSSLYSGKPLQHLVDAHLSDKMIQAIAREAKKGGLLLVATTDVVTGMPAVWDLGAIALNGGPNTRTLLRDILVASASVPGMFPPVMIRVNKDGAP
jgi:Patatin-like phospholipase